MKTSKIIVTLLIVLLSSVTAISVMAATAQDVVTYTGKGTITFNHKAHGEKLGCAACHDGDKQEKIAIENKKQGHAKCLACHKQEKKKGNSAAPTKCNQCHKK